MMIYLIFHLVNILESTFLINYLKKSLKKLICMPTNSVEIKKLFGLLIAMGAIRFPRLRMYWDSQFRIDIFKQNMSRNRFSQLRNNLHLVDNLWRPIYDAIRNRCKQLQLEKILCIDEQIVPFRGNLNVKQYVKGKPCPWGIKVFVLCGKSGLAYDFLLYQSSKTELDFEIRNKFGLGPAVVLHLCHRITTPGHELFYDKTWTFL